MKKTFVLCLVVLFAVTAIATVASAKKVDTQAKQFKSLPRPDAPLPPDLVGQVGSLRSAAAADTFILLDEDFDSSNGDINNLPAGWSTADVTDQLAAFWHVADNTELDGGTFGNLVPLNGAKSMWCGVDATTAVPYCGYAWLPGYGNGWDQILESALTAGDSIRLQYNVFFDSEPGYDGTVVEYTFDGGSTWYSFPITDTLSARALLYDNISLTPYITETVTNQIAGSPGGNVKARFRFNSDGAWSDEDGLWPTDGAIMVDNITLQTWSGGTPGTDNLETFETAATGSNVSGLWTGKKATAFGNFAAMYPGVAVTQEDPCQFVPLFMWGFFDDPLSTAYDCHTPNPLPGQGAMAFGTDEGIYLSNEVWSPAVPNIGTGVEYRFRFLSYRDLPLDNLQFYVYHVRSWTQPTVGPLCPGTWKDNNFVYYGGQRDWIRTTFQVGPYLDASADAVQVAVGAIDQCGVWCNIYGTGACHSHAPLVDEWILERIATFGPQYSVRHINIFQDNFAGDGTLTGTARADAAIDVLPSNSPGIQPGDSVAVTINPIYAPAGSGPSGWLYARVHNGNAPKSGAGLGSPDTRDGITGPRWPHVGSWVDANSYTWEIFKMDTAFTAAGGVVADRYCVDLNDALFVPGDTIRYFLGADADGTLGNGNENYWYRALDGQGGPQAGNTTGDREVAAASPCEFEILPSGGYNRGGDILYVDDTDDRGGPAQLFFDSAFDMLGIRDKIDRFDVMGPSSAVGNSLASRVTANINQIINVYRKIIWSSGNLSSATIGDGTGNPEKSDDFGLLEQFIRTSDKGPGLYISGDDVAEEWVTLGGAGAVLLKSSWIPFNLLDGDHINFGEVVSPTFTGTSSDPAGPEFSGKSFVGYGGCALINDFDVLQPTGQSIENYPYPNAGTGNGSAVISAATTNAASVTAKIVLSGISFHYIRDAVVQFPPARVDHLRTILLWLGNIVPEASGVPGGGPQFANALFNAYPNPFNPTTTIKYSIKDRGHVSLKVYNAAGQLIRTLVDEVQAPDQIQPVTWDGANNAGQTVSSGVYFYKLVTNNFSQTKKMVLLK